MREAQALAGLEHPNIVKVFDTGEMNGQLFLSLEYVRGISLEDLLERTQQPLGFSFVLSVARQLASALDHAHSRGIIHRDVKPENVMIDRRGMIKLTDFGLAKPIEELSKGRTIVCGTPYYMSPEQIEGRDFDHRTDIYALGVTLFRLFSGKLPFTEGNIFAQHSFCEPPDPCTINPAVPRAAGDAILKCLAKKPDDRPASALQVYELVENAISG
jgi:serine/threonine protein kinase